MCAVICNIHNEIKLRLKNVIKVNISIDHKSIMLLQNTGMETPFSFKKSEWHSFIAQNKPLFAKFVEENFCQLYGLINPTHNFMMHCIFGARPINLGQFLSTQHILFLLGIFFQNNSSIEFPFTAIKRKHVLAQHAMNSGFEGINNIKFLAGLLFGKHFKARNFTLALCKEK